MASLGTKKQPAVVRVQTPDRAQRALDFCQENEIVVIVGVEPDKPEDLSDIERALRAREPARSAIKLGRNDPCSCGSGKKFKKCCDGQAPRLPS
jgi:SWIM/SEC-C metal-binding protein